MNSQLNKVLRDFVKIQLRSRRSSSSAARTVTLSYDKYDVKRDSSETSTGHPLLILHGWFGCRDHFRHVGKTLNEELNPYRTVYTMDSRNHGSSPKAPEHNYDALTADLKEMYNHLGITRASLLGHSMGGRIMLNLALKYPDMAEKLIVVDMTQYNKRRNYDRVELMLNEMADLKLNPKLPLEQGRVIASDMLARIGIDPITREFLLLSFDKTAAGEFQWRMGIPALKANIFNVLMFPPQNLDDKQFMGETLFIGGADSNYIERKDIDRIRIHFPKAQLEFIKDAGHLVYAEKPDKFIKVVSKFLNEK